MAANTKFFVAIHVLAKLEHSRRQGIDRLSSADIATSVEIHPVAIRQTLIRLEKAGLVRTKEGKSGGASLGRRASEIRLDEVHCAIERPELFSVRFMQPQNGCPVSRGIQQMLDPIFGEANKAVRTYLSERTVCEVVDGILERRNQLKKTYGRLKSSRRKKSALDRSSGSEVDETSTHSKGVLK